MKASTVNGSVERVYRTVLQLAISAPVIMASVVAAHILTIDQAAKVTGIAAGVVAVVTAVHNALESGNVLPAILRYVPPKPQAEIPADFAAN